MSYKKSMTCLRGEKQLKELEKENSRLKRLVADLSMYNAILKEAVRLV